MLKNKKNIIILILTIIVFILSISIIFVLQFSKETNSRIIDGSKMDNDELYELFKSEGYNIEITKFSDTPSTTYAILENKTEGITIQRIYNQYVDTLMTFNDDSVNDEMADLLYSDRNATEGEKRQYKVYQSWLNHYNITKTQLSKMIDNYYNNNLNKINIIDTSDLLSY